MGELSQLGESFSFGGSCRLLSDSLFKVSEGVGGCC